METIRPFLTGALNLAKAYPLTTVAGTYMSYQLVKAALRRDEYVKNESWVKGAIVLAATLYLDQQFPDVGGWLVGQLKSNPVSTSLLGIAAIRVFQASTEEPKPGRKLITDEYGQEVWVHYERNDCLRFGFVALLGVAALARFAGPKYLTHPYLTWFR
ncbi:MAG: hypothetical protein AB7F31_03800 [Parachlamydiales bacterium]